MAKPVLYQIKTKDTSWGPGCSEHIANHFEKRGYQSRALVVQGEPVGWTYEWQWDFDGRWFKTISLTEPKNITAHPIRNVKPLYE